MFSRGIERGLLPKANLYYAILFTINLIMSNAKIEFTGFSIIQRRH